MNLNKQFGKHKMLLGRGHEGAGEGPEEERKKEGVRVYTWKRLTPLTGIDTMRKGFRDMIRYTQFFIY